ncbi:MAG: dGTPase [Thiomicrospira sp.]|nr:MAG: dGTPase [Thiomicrospira sp.]
MPLDQKCWEERFFKEEQRESDIRSQWERDFARIIHSAAYRRLQAKTQVLGLGESDFYRTRLTHSMEVAQIGVGILKKLKHDYKDPKLDDHYEIADALPKSALMNAICMAHDLGHPPFGHGGEVALNLCMRKYGGFEGNGQTLRILSKLEKYTASNGLNPTRRLLLGILKYPTSYYKAQKPEAYGRIPKPKWLCKANKQKPPKCYLDSENEIVNWVLKPLNEGEKNSFTSINDKGVKKHSKSNFKGLDTSIMELADDISYSLHDLEDALSLGLIIRDDWDSHFKDFLDLFEKCNLDSNEISTGLFSAKSFERKKIIGLLVNAFIAKVAIKRTSIEKATTPLIKWNAELDEAHKSLLDKIAELVREKVIFTPNVQQLEFKGQRLIIELFDVLKSDPKRLLPETTKEHYLKQGDKSKQMRVICDFIAGMTDEYATRLYEKLCNPHKGSIFDRL